MVAFSGLYECTKGQGFGLLALSVVSEVHGSYLCYARSRLPGQPDPILLTELVLSVISISMISLILLSKATPEHLEVSDNIV